MTQFLKLLDWIDINKLNWEYLSVNPNAIHLISEALEQNRDKIYWRELSRNPGAIHLLEKNIDKINWCKLSSNPGAIHLLEKNQDKINWDELCYNPGIFTYDYDKIRAHCLIFKEDIMKNRFHPRNIPKFRDWGIDGFEDYEEE